MTPNGVLQIAIFFLIILALTKPLGSYMANLFDGKRTFLHPCCGRWKQWCTS